MIEIDDFCTRRWFIIISVNKHTFNIYAGHLFRQINIQIVDISISSIDITINIEFLWKIRREEMNKSVFRIWLVKIIKNV